MYEVDPKETACCKRVFIVKNHLNAVMNHVGPAHVTGHSILPNLLSSTKCNYWNNKHC